MTSKEIKALNKYILTSKWKVTTCFEGKSCWCRMIVCTKIPKGADKDDYVVISSASINKLVADHIVKTHNEYVKKYDINRSVGY